MRTHYTIGAYDAQMSCVKMAPGGLTLAIAKKRANEAFGDDFLPYQILIWKHSPGKAREIVACRSPGSKVWGRNRDESTASNDLGPKDLTKSCFDLGDSVVKAFSEALLFHHGEGMLAFSLGSAAFFAAAILSLSASNLCRASCAIMQ